MGISICIKVYFSLLVLLLIDLILSSHRYDSHKLTVDQHIYKRLNIICDALPIFPLKSQLSVHELFLLLRVFHLEELVVLFNFFLTLD